MGSHRVRHNWSDLAAAAATLTNCIHNSLCQGKSHQTRGFPGDSVLKNLLANERDVGSVPGMGRSPGGGCGNAFQYSCLENPMARRAWWATVRRVTKRARHNLATKYQKGGSRTDKQCQEKSGQERKDKEEGSLKMERKWSLLSKAT